jgi:hypothetical protein
MAQLGRPSRRQRRELARETAKQLLAGQRSANGQPAFRKWELLGAVASVLIPFGWQELMSGHEAWRLLLGWILWFIPLLLFLHIFWCWSSEKGWYRPVRFVLAAALVTAFLAVSTYSLWRETLPDFVFLKPGIALNERDPLSAAWMFIIVLRGKEPMYNTEVQLEDINKTEYFAERLRKGDNVTHDQLASELYRNQYPELDPHPGITGMDTEVDTMFWHPLQMADQKYVIGMHNRTSGVVENLEIKKANGSWQYAMRVVDDKSHDILIRCRDSRFPVSTEWPAALPGCFPQYWDRDRDLTRYKLLALRMLGLRKFD